MIWQIGDLRFAHGVLVPPASWNRVQFAEQLEEIALAFSECETCAATIAVGEPMICDDCNGVALEVL